MTLMTSVSILHSDYLHLRLNVIVASTFYIKCLWLLVSISVFPVGDFFSNKEIHTFSHIRAHQASSETFNTSLWRRKTKPASVNNFVIVVLATDKTCGTYPWQVSVFSLLWNIMFWKWLHHNVKNNLFHISTNIPAFFLVHWLARGPRDQYRCLQW